VVERIRTTTVLQSVPNPSDPNESVTFTATVTDPSSAPVTTGSVTFTVDGIPITGGAVALNSSGIATFDTAALASGAHTVIATYAENDTYGTSTAMLNQVVRPVAAANGPYTVAEGSSLTLDAAGSTAGAIYAWDVNGDGDFTDATGSAPTLNWTQLEGLGVSDGPSTRTVTLRVTLDGGSADSDAELTVTNTAPASVLTGGLAATVGVPFTIKVGADDPSSADMAALFTYTVDWGDGSPVVSVVGPADPPVTHTYAAPGDYAASFTATDKDGGTGAPTSVTIRAGDAPIVTPSPTPTTSDPDEYDDYDDADYSDSDDSGLASTGSTVGPETIALGLILLVSGTGMLLASRRRRVGGPRHRG
jgi:LPXTG-motif cell wall-anchored protein